MGTKPNSVTNPNPTETYTASKTVSGVSLPAGAPLRLTGGQMLANPAAAPWLNQEGHPANAVPEGQSGIPLRKIARWILVLEIEAGESLDLAKVRDYAEKVALPLRLGTPAPVLLDSLKVTRGQANQVLVQGVKQAALEPVGSNFYVELSQSDSATLEAALPQLTYQPRYAPALVHFLDAFYQATDPDAGLKYLLALETLFDPNGRARGRNSRVAGRSATFAADSLQRRRAMRKVVELAYKHRGTLRHGETNAQEIVAAQEWFRSTGTESLRMIASWAIQRVLRLSVIEPQFDLPGYVRLADEGDQDVLRRIVELPLFWATMGRRIIQLDLAQSQMAGGLEVEFFRNPADITE